MSHSSGFLHSVWLTGSVLEATQTGIQAEVFEICLETPSPWPHSFSKCSLHGFLYEFRWVIHACRSVDTGWNTWSGILSGGRSGMGWDGRILSVRPGHTSAAWRVRAVPRLAPGASELQHTHGSRSSHIPRLLFLSWNFYSAKADSAAYVVIKPQTSSNCSWTSLACFSIRKNKDVTTLREFTDKRKTLILDGLNY